MNVLVIVPFDSKLALLPSEAETLINLLQPRRVLQGDVTEDRLRTAITEDVARGGPFDGVWFATHSSERHIKLSDVQLDREALAQYVVASGAEWAVLNSCESEGLATAITSCGVDVLAVAMTDDASGISDRKAWRMANMLASALAAHDGNLSEAFASIPNASGTYRHFPGAAAVRSIREEEHRTYQLLYELQGDVSALKARYEDFANTVRFFGALLILATIANIAVTAYHLIAG